MARISSSSRRGSEPTESRPTQWGMACKARGRGAEHGAAEISLSLDVGRAVVGTIEAGFQHEVQIAKHRVDVLRQVDQLFRTCRNLP